LKTSTRSTSRIVHHALDVKGWFARPPSVEAARPGSCPGCGAASRPTGGRLGLHGHGLRDRQLRGPPEVEAAPVVQLLECRRYRCVACLAVILVVPRGVAPRRHYGHAAIAMALTLWALLRESAAAVRRRVCASPITVSGTDWPALRRWARALGDPTITPRAAAARPAQIAVGRSPPPMRAAPLWAQAFAGGSAMP
jgi:hypothetical protein